MIRMIAAAALGLAVAMGSAQAASLADLVPGYAVRSLPDLQSNVDDFDVVAPATLADVGGGRARLTAAVSLYDPFLNQFAYTPETGPFTYLDDAAFSLDVEFDRLGDGSTHLSDNLSASTNTFSISGIPQAVPSNWTGASGDPILTGSLIAVGTEENQIDLLWKVTGGRAASAFGGYAVTFLSAAAINYNAATGIAPFTLDAYNMDTKPAAVPLPGALPLAALGLGALAMTRVRRRRG